MTVARITGGVRFVLDYDIHGTRGVRASEFVGQLRILRECESRQRQRQKNTCEWFDEYGFVFLQWRPEYCTFWVEHDNDLSTLAAVGKQLTILYLCALANGHIVMGLEGWKSYLGCPLSWGFRYWNSRRTVFSRRTRLVLALPDDRRRSEVLPDLDKNTRIYGSGYLNRGAGRLITDFVRRK
jgi:hypothetical protein